MTAQTDQHEHKTFQFKVTALDYEGRTIEGYAATFGNVDQGNDIIHPGAFAKTLVERGNKVRFLWQHDMHEPIGRPLEMHEDPNGLFIKAIVSDTTRGRDALALMRDGAISGLSIGYDAIPGGTDYTKGEDDESVRNLRELRLWEFSLCTFPMNEQAGVTALKATDGDITEREKMDTPKAEDDTHERKQALVESLRAALAEAESLLESPAPAEEAGRAEDADDQGAGPEPPPTPTDTERERLELLSQIEARLTEV